MLPVGEAAPDFTAEDERGERVTLSDFRGRSAVVLVFYPGDSTPLCTQQLGEFRDRYEELRRAGVEVFGVNPFGAGSHRRFAESQGFPFRLLVDRGLGIARRFGITVGLGPLSWVGRGVIAIDRDGQVVFSEKGKPDPAKVLAALREAGSR